MSYQGFQSYSGNYQTPSNVQNSQYGFDRSSSAASPALATPTYQPASGRDQYSGVGNIWPDRNSLGQGGMSGSVQTYDSTRWKDGQAHQTTFDYQAPQSSYATPATSYAGQNGWYSTTTTQSNTMSSTQALSNLADASRVGLQGQQSYGDRKSGTRNTGNTQYVPAQHDQYSQGRVRSPLRTGPYPVSNVRNLDTSQSNKGSSPLQQYAPASALSSQGGNVSRIYNNSPRPQHASPQHYQVPTSTPKLPETQGTNAIRPIQTYSQAQTSPQPRQSRPVSDISMHSNYGSSRYETTESPRPPQSNASTFTLLPLPIKKNSETDHFHAGTQHQNQSTVPGTSFVDHGRSSAVYAPQKTNTESFQVAPQQQGQQSPPAVPNYVDPSQLYNPQHQRRESLPGEEAERSRRAATMTSQPSRSVGAGEVSTSPSDEVAVVPEGARGLQQLSQAAVDQQGTVRRSSEVGFNAARESKEPDENGMAGEMKQMMQRMREWRTKDPSLFQKLWDDMKKGSNSGTTQPARGQTPTPRPAFAQTAAQQAAKAPSPQLPASQDTTQIHSLTPGSTQPTVGSSIHVQSPPILLTGPGTQDASGIQASKSRPTPSATKKSSVAQPQEVTRAPAAQSRRGRAGTRMTAKVQTPRKTQTSHRHPPSLQRQLPTASESDRNGNPSVVNSGNQTGTPTSLLAGTQKQMSTTCSLEVDMEKRPLQKSQQMSSNTMPAAAAPISQAKNLQENPKLPPMKTPAQNSQPEQLAAAALANPSVRGSKPEELTRQALSPTSLPGSTILPEAKRKALAEATQNALMGLDVNKHKSITAAEIHTLLEQNPSYTDLCTELEKRGFTFHRGQFARYLLNNVPDLSSPSPSQSGTPQQAASLRVSKVSTPSSVPGSQSLTTALPTTDHSTPVVNQPYRPSPSVNYSVLTSGDPKASPFPQARSRLGVPSPLVVAPLPGSKEAAARKRNFSELVDLTQLSDEDDEDDYVMPQKESYSETGRGGEVAHAHSGMMTFYPRVSSLLDSSQESRTKPPLKQAGRSVYQNSTQPTYKTPSGQAVQQKKSQICLAKPLNKAEALRKSYYNPKTIARDVLIAAGRHPDEEPLNAHLAGLLGNRIDNDSDLGTFDWDTVDPGGPPMPIAEIVNIPAGPPKWVIGEKPLLQDLPAVSSEVRARIPPQDVSRRPADEAAVNHDAPDRPPEERAGKRKKTSKHLGPDSLFTPIGYMSTTMRLPQDKIPQPPALPPPPPPPQLQQQDKEAKAPNPKGRPPTKFHRRKIANNESMIASPVVSGSSSSKSTKNTKITEVMDDTKITERTPHLTDSDKTTVSTSVAPEHRTNITTVLGSDRRSIMMEQIVATPPEKRRKGRPPGAKNKHSSLAALKKSARTFGLEVSIPTPHGATSPKYNVYACEWDGCAAELHNLSTLRKHIHRAHKIAEDVTNAGGQSCQWKNCRISDATFNSSSDWSKHLESKHLYPLGMKLGDGPSVAQTGKPVSAFEVSKYFYHAPALTFPSPPNHTPASRPSCSLSDARTLSHTDPQTVARDRSAYLSDSQGRVVTAPSTDVSIANYPADTLVLSSVSMNAESNVPNRAYSKVHGNDKMDVKQSAIETLIALQKHKEKVGPGLDRGGCTLVNDERRTTLSDSEDMAKVVDGDY